jgi:hypothetical protein
MVAFMFRFEIGIFRSRAFLLNSIEFLTYYFCYFFHQQKKQPTRPTARLNDAVGQRGHPDRKMPPLKIPIKDL